MVKERVLEENSPPGIGVQCARRIGSGEEKAIMEWHSQPGHNVKEAVL